MTECDEVARGMRDDFLDWIRAEDRELTHYAARRFVTRQMPDESHMIRDNVAMSLYADGRAHELDHTMRQRIEEIGGDVVGTW